jgi:protein TonB
MARAIQVNSLGFVEWLLRLRPGVAISIGLHAALLLFLAVMLALPPKDPSPPEDRNAIIEMAEPPVTPNPKPAAQPIFRPEPMPTLARTQTQVPPLPLPPVRIFSREQSTVATAEEPSQAEAQSEPPLIVDPRPISRGGLVYPERAAEHDIAGFVDFSFTIEPDGSVGNAEVTAEEPEGYGFADAARKAFRQWRFEPRRVDGKAVSAPARIRVTFKPQ